MWRGTSQIGLIAHSQGAGAAFISLSEGMRPDIGEKISCTVALAPAVYAGPLTTTWLFTTLGRLDWDAWMRWFGVFSFLLLDRARSSLSPDISPGVLDFIPLMRYSYDWVPSPRLFSLIGYAMFAYLFSWTDANWLLRRKTKQFRFTPTPVRCVKCCSGVNEGADFVLSVPQVSSGGAEKVGFLLHYCDHLLML